MNSKFIKYFLPIICFLIGCEKKPFDYRNKYWGTYNFTYTRQDYGMNGPYPLIHGNTTCKIYYTKNSANDILYVNFPSNIDTAFSVDYKGNFTSCGGAGKFTSNNSIQFTYNTSNCLLYGMGGGSQYTINGTKK